MRFKPELFQREDESPDEMFYSTPRLVTHIDESAIDRVTALYRHFLPDSGAILDLMSSWVSHLPAEARYQRVVGLGMSREELSANPRLDHYIVHNPNREPQLPFEDAEFDGAALCVSIQYLTQPVLVMKEIGRVLRPGSPIIITFSNRCFPTKAIAAWRMLDSRGHLELVSYYLLAARNWTDIRKLDHSPPAGDPLYAVVRWTVGSTPGLTNP